MEIKGDYSVSDGFSAPGGPAGSSDGKPSKRQTQYEKRKDYLNSYRCATYDEIKIRLRRDGIGLPDGITKDCLCDAAAAAGTSLSEFIIQRICDGMRLRGEFIPEGGSVQTSKNEAFLVRGGMAAELIATARELGEEPREMVLNAVRRHYEEKMRERR